MYRNIILDFLSTKHLLLSDSAYYQMTICQIGSDYSNSPMKLIENEDKINVYHIKEPRVYHKSYEFDLLNSSIISMLLEIKEEVKFNKTELSFEMNDPYYLKNLETMDFISLQAVPIFQEEVIIGVIIVYYKKENGSVKFTNNELVKLLNNLTMDRINDLNVKIDDLFVKQNEYFKVIMKDNLYYLNDNVKSKLRIKDNLVNIKELKNPEKLINFIRQHGMKKINVDSLTVYYMDQSKLSSKQKDVDVHAMYKINEHNMGSSFSYIMVRNSPNSTIEENLKEISKWLEKFDDIEYKIYEYNNETLIILVNRKIIKKDIEFLVNQLKDEYIILLRSGNDLTDKMNLKRISNYLYDLQPEKFIYQDYIEWITNHNDEALSYSDTFKDFNTYYEILNVNGMKSLGKASFLPLRSQYRDSHFISYQSVVRKELIRISKNVQSNVFINIPFSLLNKRKTYEDIKKLLINDNKIWLNIMYDGDYNYDEFIKLVSKYKKFNLKTSCDSSVYLNYYLMPSLDLFDAIYIQNEEYENIRKNEVGLPQAIFQYMIKEYKYLIIENLNPNPDLDYNHSNCYYVLKRKIDRN